MIRAFYRSVAIPNRGFLEVSSEADGVLLRQISAEIILAFISSQILRKIQIDPTQLWDNPLITRFAHK
ncbi:MAG: hypothetical protein M9928_14810 [Anaerolineae bacterium]|nr:hypothetical protein [Anaerolineae bacterium]MCO5206303.1 hypothetical protein [Anaerolineae bacterium]